METGRTKIISQSILAIIVILCMGIITMFPIFSDTYKRNIWSLLFLKKSLEGSENEEQLITPPQRHMNASIWLAREAINSNDITRAVSIIEPTIYLKNPIALSLIGEINLRQNRISNAIQIWANIGDLYSLSKLASTAQEKGELSTALDAYMAILSIDPNISRIYFEIAQIYSQQENFTEADRWYEKAIELHPDNWSWQFTRAIVAKKAKNFDLSESVLKHMNLEYPDSAITYYEIAWVYYLKENYNLAQENIENAMRLKTNPEAGYFYLAGLIYQNLGENDKAIESFENVLGIHSEHKEAKRRLEILKPKY